MDWIINAASEIAGKRYFRVDIEVQEVAEIIRKHLPLGLLDSIKKYMEAAENLVLTNDEDWRLKMLLESRILESEIERLSTSTEQRDTAQ